jgi:hypothetical protein
MMQKIWFVIFSLEKALQANVLGTYLDPENNESKASPTLTFAQLKSNLVNASKILEPYVVLELKTKDD